MTPLGLHLTPKYLGSQLTDCSVEETHRIDDRTEVGAEAPGQITSAPRREPHSQAWGQGWCADRGKSKSARMPKAYESSLGGVLAGGRAFISEDHL